VAAAATEVVSMEVGFTPAAASVIMVMLIAVAIVTSMEVAAMEGAGMAMVTTDVTAIIPITDTVVILEPLLASAF
jgi:hypothetical protein